MVSLEDFAELFEYLWCEQVGPSVDDVAHECLRLFNIMQHLWYDMCGMVRKGGSKILNMSNEK